jgi:cytochrome c peroxidase
VRGRRLFENASVGCAVCHTGVKLTDNKTQDVGTGGRFQTPSLLGIAWRPPFMHDGCAPTLTARLADGACGGGNRHGNTSTLSAAERADLVAYLESL